MTQNKKILLPLRVIWDPIVDALGHTCHVRNLKQHCRGEVDALHELQVDVHVERYLTTTINLLLLW